MVVIVFVRHGRATNNEKNVLNDDIEGFPLTREGILAVKKTAQELKQLYVLRVYSSPILRAKQTADIIGDVLELTPVLDDRLKERSYGEMYNKPNDDGRWKFEVDWSDTDVESLASMQQRMSSFIESVSRLKGIVVVVSHDSMIKSVFMTLFKLNEMMENGLKIDNASINVMSTKDDWKALVINYPKLTEPLIQEITKNL